jgi:hypothetical protein
MKRHIELRITTNGDSYAVEGFVPVFPGLGWLLGYQWKFLAEDKDGYYFSRSYTNMARRSKELAEEIMTRMYKEWDDWRGKRYRPLRNS